MFIVCNIAFLSSSIYIELHNFLIKRKLYKFLNSPAITGNADSVNGDSAADDEQIYWLRPKLRPSPTRSPNDANAAPTSEKGWLNKKLKPKVTFNDLPSTSGSR